MSPITKPLVGHWAFWALMAPVVYITLQGLRWAARVWGVEAVGVFFALPVLAIPVLALWSDRLDRKRDAEPWVEIPWEARR